MLTRLAFALSMAIEFDCFLIDEAMAVGDARFHQSCHEELFRKRGDRAFIWCRTAPASSRVLHARCRAARRQAAPVRRCRRAYDFYMRELGMTQQPVEA